MLPLDHCTDPEVAGTKAATLAKLRAAGHRVPDGVVIPVGGLDGAAGVAGRVGTERLAVRSSAVAEDLADDSHAGQYASVLDVPADDAALLAAARRVVASANGGPIAVLIQAMVPAVAAGAAFSRNPVTGDDEVVVSAVAGLADRLLAGEASGEQWVVRQGTAELRANPSAVLDAALVVEIGELAQRVAGRLGVPADIEWAFDGTELWLLQARPITALPRRPELPDLPEGTWDKDATHHPGPISPLAGSLLGRDEGAVARWAGRAGLLIDGLDHVVRGGELYVRPVPLGGKAGGPTPPWWVVAIVARVHPAIRRRMKAAEAFAADEVFRAPHEVWERRWKPELEAAVAELRSVDLGELDAAGLLEHVEEIFGLADRSYDIHFDLFVPYLVRLHELVVACEEWLGWDAGQAMRLLAGHSSASSEPTTALRGVVDQIQASAPARAEFDGPDGDLVARLRAADPDVAAALDAWIDRYGFRTLHYDFASPTLAERPDLIGRMIRSELAAGTEVQDAAATEAEARARLAPPGAARFDELLARAREVYPVREDNVLLTALVPAALLRRACLEIGRRLSGGGTIAEAADVFFLEWDEAVAALAEPAPLQPLVRQRRAERAWVAAHPGPARIGPEPTAPPDIRGLPAAGRRINGALLWGIDEEFAPITGDHADDAVVRGLAGGTGRHTGTARIVRSEADFHKVQSGDVVVCAITNPVWSVLFGVAGAFVCDAGGPLSHTAILAREFAIPSVLATGNATSQIADGATVTVDGSAGTVHV